VITLAWPWVLLALPLPLLVRWLLPPAPASVGEQLRLPSLAGLAPMAATRPAPCRARQALAVLIWLMLLLAAARPQWLGDPVLLPVSGRDLMLAVDISGSMEQPDYEANGRPATRLAVVRTAASRFIARRTQDRLGLILFGSRPYVQSPLTYDRDAVMQLLDEAIVGLAGQDTAIGDAIALAVKRLRDAPPGERVLVLLTDGDNTAGAVAPLTAAKLAARIGIRIHTIGLSGRAGEATTSGYRIQRAADDLNPALLRAVAAATGGRFFRATDAAELEQVYDLLDRLEPSIRDSRTYRPAQERYVWPAGLALLLSLAPALWRLGWPERRRGDDAAVGGAGTRA
jgi:Ca-activated chloride channel family protein